MTAFPARGQRAPEYWDTQLKAYIDETSVAAADAPQPASKVSDFTEAVQDAVAAMLVSGSNVTLTYNDAAGTLQVTAAGGDAEVMRDTIGAALVGTTGIVVTVNDVADTITLSISGLTISQVTGLQTALDDLTANKEPLRTAVTQAEAEAGTATTVRGWTALRVKQAAAAYIANNVAAVKAILGVASAAYLWSSTGSATVAVTGSHRVAVAQTLVEARMRTATAPAGSALTVELQRQVNGAGAWGVLTTLTIAAGSTTENVQAVTTSLAAGDLLRLNVTSVGSTTAATGVVVEVYPA